MQEHYELLSAMPVFGGLDEATLQLLTSLAVSVELSAGEHFFREGDDSQAMYVLQTGRVRIYKSWKGDAKPLRWMEAGDCFGEMALIDLFPRSASALAATDCEALQITANVLHQVQRHDLEQFTLLQMNIGREVSRRLRQVDDMLFRALMGEMLPQTVFHDYS